MASETYWSLSQGELERQPGITADGLTSAAAAQRLAQFGPNQLADAQRHPVLRIFFGQFRSAIVLILLMATVLSVLLQDWGDAAIILTIVLGSALLSFFQE